LLAVNSRGETAFLGNAGGIERLLVITPGDLQARSVATVGAPLAGGLLTAVEQMAIDEDGRVSFIGRLTGRQMLFFWDRTKVDVVAQTGPATPTLTDFFSISTSGRDHYAVFNYSWGFLEVRAYDGTRWTDVTSVSRTACLMAVRCWRRSASVSPGLAKSTWWRRSLRTAASSSRSTSPRPTEQCRRIGGTPPLL